MKTQLVPKTNLKMEIDWGGGGDLTYHLIPNAFKAHALRMCDWTGNSKYSMTFHLICSKSDGSENSKLSSYKCNRNRLQQFLLLFTNHFHYISVWIYISFKIVLIYVCFYCEITYQWLFLLFSSFCDLFFNWDFFISGNGKKISINKYSDLMVLSTLFNINW